MASDGNRLGQVTEHIRRLKAAEYPVIEDQADGPGGGWRVVERPWQALPEGRKLAILREAVDWTGISNGDLAVIMLSEIDFARVSEAEREGLTDMMAGRSRSYAELLREASARGAGALERGEDRGVER